jgi:hypothetical protein
MARDFYRGAGRVVSTPWQFASGGNFAYPETVGPRPRGVDLVNRYSTEVQLAAQVSGDVRRAFSVQQLVAPPWTLWTPSMVAKVLSGARRARGTQAPG